MGSSWKFWKQLASYRVELSLSQSFHFASNVKKTKGQLNSVTKEKLHCSTWTFDFNTWQQQSCFLFIVFSRVYAIFPSDFLYLFVFIQCDSHWERVWFTYDSNLYVSQRAFRWEYFDSRLYVLNTQAYLLLGILP